MGDAQSMWSAPWFGIIPSLEIPGVIPVVVLLDYCGTEVEICMAIF